MNKFASWYHLAGRHVEFQMKLERTADELAEIALLDLWAMARVILLA